MKEEWKAGMHTLVRPFVLLMALSLSTPLSAEPLNSIAPGHPIAREFQEMWPQHPNGDTGVQFVVGNDLWQPRQQFKPGNNWLGLTCDAVGCTLEPANLSIKPEFWQGHYDEKPTFGQHLTFSAESAPGETVAWFSTASAQDWLNPGRVPTYYSRKGILKQPSGRGTLEALIELPNNQSALLVPMLATQDFLRRIEPERRHDWPTVVLQLRAQNRRQLLRWVLGACEGMFHPRDYLLWAGDLDRDGRPDYLISFVDADGPVHLYLSSLAKPDQLVGLAGVYESPPSGGECSPDGYMTFRHDDE